MSRARRLGSVSFHIARYVSTIVVASAMSNLLVYSLLTPHSLSEASTDFNYVRSNAGVADDGRPCRLLEGDGEGAERLDDGVRVGPGALPVGMEGSIDRADGIPRLEPQAFAAPPLTHRGPVGQRLPEAPDVGVRGAVAVLRPEHRIRVERPRSRISAGRVQIRLPHRPAKPLFRGARPRCGKLDQAALDGR